MCTIRETKSYLIVCSLILFLCAGLCQAQGFKAFEEQCSEHVLSNGMKFIVLERPDVPVVCLVNLPESSSEFHKFLRAFVLAFSDGIISVA